MRLTLGKRSGFIRNRSGATAVEFALIGGPFFMILFATIETFAIGGARLLLDDAADSVARQVLTGQVQAADLDQAKFKTLMCNQVGFLLDCKKLKIDLRTYPTFGQINTNIALKLSTVDDSSYCFDPGAANSITVMRVAYEWPWTASFLDSLAAKTNGNAILYSLAAFQNEPFGDGKSTHATCS